MVGLHVDDGVVEVGAEVAGGVQGPGQPQVVISLGHLPDNTQTLVMATQGPGSIPQEHLPGHHVLPLEIRSVPEDGNCLVLQR